MYVDPLCSPVCHHQCQSSHRGRSGWCGRRETNWLGGKHTKRHWYAHAQCLVCLSPYWWEKCKLFCRQPGNFAIIIGKTKPRPQVYPGFSSRLLRPKPRRKAWVGMGTRLGKANMAFVRTLMILATYCIVPSELVIHGPKMGVGASI